MEESSIEDETYSDKTTYNHDYDRTNDTSKLSAIVFRVNTTHLTEVNAHASVGVGLG